MRYPQGMFGWVDLTTTDTQASIAFYADLLGWEATAVPTDVGTEYTLLRKDGQLVAGLGPLPPEQAEAGVPSAWTPYVMVGDAEEIVAATPGAGGEVIVPDFDVMTMGRMGIVADPSGAAFGVWQPVDHEGAEVFGVPGSLTWVELQSRDMPAAIPFYEELFGWRWEHDAVGGTDYSVAHLTGPGLEDADTTTPTHAGGTMNAGAMAMPEGVPPEAPSMWGVYFAVEDADAAVSRATAAGAQLAVPPMDFDGGRFASFIDPQGAFFSVMAERSA